MTDHPRAHISSEMPSNNTNQYMFLSVFGPLFFCLQVTFLKLLLHLGLIGISVGYFM